MTRRLLLLGCSATKWRDPGDLPALDRYDGPVFRVVRQRRREGRRLPLMLILSAAYGLIGPQNPVTYYDQRLDDQTAAMWSANPPGRELFRRAYLAAGDVFTVAGWNYLQVSVVEFFNRKFNPAAHSRLRLCKVAVPR